MLAETPHPEVAFERDEMILRRIPVHKWPADDDDPDMSSFLPRRPIKSKPGDRGDVDGLSVSREIITGLEAASKGADDKMRHVAGIEYKHFEPLEISVTSNAQSHDPGHCLVTELNITDYLDNKEKKTWIKGVAAQLCMLAVVRYRVAT